MSKTYRGCIWSNDLRIAYIYIYAHCIMSADVLIVDFFEMHISLMQIEYHQPYSTLCAFFMYSKV